MKDMKESGINRGWEWDGKINLNELGRKYNSPSIVGVKSMNVMVKLCTVLID